LTSLDAVERGDLDEYQRNLPPLLQDRYPNRVCVILSPLELASNASRRWCRHLECSATAITG